VLPILAFSRRFLKPLPEESEGDGETRGDPSFSSRPHLFWRNSVLRLFSAETIELTPICGPVRFPQRRELTSCESSAVLIMKRKREREREREGGKGRRWRSSPGQATMGSSRDCARGESADAEELKWSDESALRESTHQ